MTKNTIILINLGTPSHLSLPAIRKFLNQFLMDRRVISIPYFFRLLLVNLIIKPFRPSRIINNYKNIWFKNGSPLTFYTINLQKKLKVIFGDNFNIDFAMRYGNPSIKNVLNTHIKYGVKKIVIVPLFPQYASATVGSVNEEIYKSLAKYWHSPAVNIIKPFFDNSLFIEAQAEIAKKYLSKKFDHYLFSYHGLPIKHLKCGENNHNICLKTADCCNNKSKNNSYCYRSHCIQTTKLLVEKLKLDPKISTTVFQSKFGRSPWIEPALDKKIVELASKNIKNLLVICPSFVADCIETLDEVAIEADKIFKQNGGLKLTLVPCLNDNDIWATNLSKIIKQST